MRSNLKDMAKQQTIVRAVVYLPGQEALEFKPKMRTTYAKKGDSFARVSEIQVDGSMLTIVTDGPKFSFVNAPFEYELG